MRILCLGGGPAGVYFAISAKLRNPEHQVVVLERNRAGDTFGWGVVFSDQTLQNLRANDPVSAEQISASFAHWDDIEVSINGDTIRSSGHGFIGIGRKRLLNILQDRARDLGVELRFETEFSDDITAYPEFDLVVAADGINSRIRSANAAAFEADVERRANKFVWLGTTKLFDSFSFIFEKTEAGWLWAHAYRFDAEHSTFIVECSEETWHGLGLDQMNGDQSRAFCERTFAAHLDGHKLISNATHLRGSAAWINFSRIVCGRWSIGNVVLLGDAAHTAHFSIGSGTKLALEDAIKLADVLDRPELDAPSALKAALVEYQDVRALEVLKIQNSARNSTEWFETLDRYLDMAPIQFAYSLLTRSQRVSHENLRLRDHAWLERVERWFAAESGMEPVAVPPMFTPFRLRGMTLENRIVVSPVLTYQANDEGDPGAFHLTHYGARALGGAGLVMTEMTAVLPEGRATAACPGLYTDKQVAAWRAITDFAHQHSKAKIGIQIGHAGARAGMPVPGSGGSAADWDRVSASAEPWGAGCPVPAALDRGGMDAIVAAFVAAAQRADAAGFDLLELQAGHGFLLSSFLTPLMNHREDEYGGSPAGRLRFPLEVVRAVRAAWPEDKPLAVRISAQDWVGERGVQPADAVGISAALAAAGADIIDVSSGETSPEGRPVYGRMYQTPLSDQIRNEAGVATITVGNIYEADQVNSILAAGRADLVALGRPHLADPAWTLHAAAAAGYEAFVPPAYALGQAQLMRLASRPAEALQA
ncbi:bifunctional salicylyl-CoA 5-hydroxylase/oxidoreductase [Sphingomonas hengshuiensis]|uniref:Salicylyl-CoA 5-hydroxylase n=1 Tax=Sphingomonas hengshuiensis TaxID=1609977 RepID=A0A7U5BEP3_9SPHN|nr:bifunctional salicylyl-CoA 5-hydroxylase/oxidoreductase [Sphingomonas hengshuiensis]AJP70800.1 salicylyl-CoA 5-hydroxylase [Sphingomonas hengshuiensis]